MKNNIVYFDGVCGLCNSTVDFLLRIDKKNNLLFSPLQGETAKERLLKNENTVLNTILFQQDTIIYSKSDAVIRILITIGGFFKIAYLGFVIPKFIRNHIYDYISRNRYNWFSKKEFCRIPTKEESVKFLP